jgi:magnesium chelatase family protein
MDRIDIRIELGREDISLETESAGDNESSATVKERVVRARRVQLKRAGLTNSVLTRRQIKQWCWPDPEGRRLLEKAAQRFVMSRRACDRTLRVARTLADLGGAETVHAKHVSEALSLRSFKRLQS